MITKAGVYDLMAEEYHRDPVAGGSLSSTGARKLVTPNCPAVFKAWRDNGEDHARHFDFGHGYHRELLGVGAPIDVIDADDYRSKAAQAARAKAHAAGHIPLLAEEYERVRAMVAVARNHPDVIPLLDMADGDPERTLVWQDGETGVWCRAMLDYLQHAWPGQTVKIVDPKSCISAHPDAISKRLFDHGYIQQADWYLRGLAARDLDGGVPPEFWFVFQEKEHPHLLTVAGLDEEALHWGHVLNRKALHVYRQCMDTDVWPSYTTGPITVGIPGWAARQLRLADEAGAFDIPTDTTWGAA